MGRVDFEKMVLPHLPVGWVESVRADLDEIIRRRGTDIVDSAAEFPCFESSRPHVATLLATQAVATALSDAMRDALHESNRHAVNDLAPQATKVRVLRELRAHPERSREIIDSAAESLTGASGRG